MSHKVTTLVYSRKAGSAHRKAILAYMADRASDDGSGVFCSKRTMADEIECSRSTVVKVCNDFEAEGILVRTGERKCAHGATIVYRICTHTVSQLPPVKESDERTGADLYPSTQRTPPVRSTDVKASAQRTQTTLEPSLNQEANASLATGPEKPPPQKSRLPEGWLPDQEMVSHAKSKELTDEDIQEIANDFFIYWNDQPKSKSAKSLNGWRQAWRNNITRVGWQYTRNRRMAGQQASFGRGQGGGLAGELARRRAQGGN